MERGLNEEELQDLYAWIDKIPLSRPKRNITRDFSDGVMAAEIVKHFFPNLVDLHNYTPANSTGQKLSNWHLLNRKVFSKLNFNVPEDSVKRIVLTTAGVIQPILSVLKEKIDKKLQNSTENIPDLGYYDARHQETLHTDYQFLRHMSGEEIKKDGKTRLRNGQVQQSSQLYSDLDPSLRQILLEKDHTVMSLKETVEILQMKVSKLEHLVQLKDMRIEDLTRHLETYKQKETFTDTYNSSV